MKQHFDLASSLCEWANKAHHVKCLVLFGSRTRDDADTFAKSDAHSDWDFHIITSQPRTFLTSTWLRDVADQPVTAYAVRAPRLGKMPKINVVIGNQEADIVIFPSYAMQAVKLLLFLNIHRISGRFRGRLGDLAVVIRPGWSLLKGGKSWANLYQKVVSDIDDPRLDNRAAMNLANAFVCDYIWANRKLARGEFFAVQRILHRELIETNITYLHEWRLRSGLRSFPDGRRLEFIASPEELSDLVVSSRQDAQGLQDAIEQQAETFRSLASKLLGSSWNWPADVTWARNSCQRSSP